VAGSPGSGRSAEQTLAILADAFDFDRFADVFTDDIVYDMEGLGYGALRGRDALREAAADLGDRNPAGHHVTNIVVTEAHGGEVRVRSKYIGVLRDGQTGTGVYEDRLTRTPEGWRIAYRAILPSNAS
jgi:3-phenylpropionate/cinnamic acid dioxygenase small subunit